jgi:hypothetical protein
MVNVFWYSGQNPSAPANEDKRIPLGDIACIPDCVPDVLISVEEVIACDTTVTPALTEYVPVPPVPEPVNVIVPSDK